MYKCSKCKATISPCEAYEYRGATACEKCFDDVVVMRDFQRNEIITEEALKTEKLKGFDIGDSAIGRANREILAQQIEIASKESSRLKAYERD